TFQRIIQRLNTTQSDCGGLRQARQLELQIEYVAAEYNHGTVRIDMHGINGLECHNLRRQQPRVISQHTHVIWPLIQGSANRTEAAGRRELAVDDQEYLLGKRFDFFEYV